MKCNIWKVAVRPSYIQDARFLKVKDNRHMKVVTSPLRTGRLYHPGNIPVTHFC